MINLTNSCSLTEFQRNAKELIENLRESKDALLLTVNGRVQAVLVDPEEFQKYEEAREREALIAAIRLGEKDYAEGRTYSVDDAFGRIRQKLNLPSANKPTG